MSRPPEHASDSGITLIEVLVSMAVITTLMMAMGSFFVTTTGLTHRLSVKQGAAQLGQDGLELVRALRGPGLLVGRAKCGMCPDPAVTGAAAYLAGTERWDAPAAGGTTALLRRPDSPEQVPLNGITYQRYWYVGKCWQPAAGGTCGLDSTQRVALVRVIVAVNWRGQECPLGACSHVTSALVSGSSADPIFAATGP